MANSTSSSTSAQADPPQSHDGWGAFRYPQYAIFQAVRILDIVAAQAIGVALAYDLYDHTHSALFLGYIGLVQFVPSVLFMLFTGTVADAYNRRYIIQLCHVIMAIATVLLIFVTLHGYSKPWPIYAILFVIGSARAFQTPAAQAMMPQLVPRSLFANAVAWNGSIFNLSTIAGPSLGGVLYGLHNSATVVYIYGAAMLALAFVLLGFVRPPDPVRENTGGTWENLVAGMRFVFERKVVLGAISLDLFAVLLGGAVALLPIYARDILKVGPQGLGILRASFAIGAVAMGFSLAHLPPLKHAGRAMFAAVAAFGLFTIVFGLSTNFWLSLFALAMLGAMDMISVVVRHTMVQLSTPDEMRGRVSAANMIFIGASNEMGEFESGLTAAWWGAVTAVVVGGVGTLAVAGLWMWMFPGLRRFKKLDEVKQEQVPNHNDPPPAEGAGASGA